MQSLENPFAGQGPVLLDIGGDIGALVVAMPPETEGLEVEIRPAGSTALATHPHDEHDHPHGEGDHRHPPDHHHDHSHDHHHSLHEGVSHHPHVGVVARPGSDGPAYSLVYPEVSEGSYDLVPIPGDTVVMTATVEGGVVTYTSWPEDGRRR
ncbi:MAG: hypothetical protein ABIQ13_08175 [Pedococcus sp.]